VASRLIERAIRPIADFAKSKLHDVAPRVFP